MLRCVAMINMLPEDCARAENLGVAMSSKFTSEDVCYSRDHYMFVFMGMLRIRREGDPDWQVVQNSENCFCLASVHYEIEISKGTELKIIFSKAVTKKEKSPKNEN